MKRGYLKAFLAAYRRGEIVFYTVNDGMITWRFNVKV